MTTATTAAPTAAARETRRDPGLAVAARLARRELRGGLRGFRVFLACLVLGVAAIAGVGSVSLAMLDGLRSNGRAILGGDVDLRLTHRQAADAQRAWLAEQGDVSDVASMRTMARSTADASKRVLVELRAVDDLYPLYGAARLAPADDLQTVLASQDGLWGAAVEDGLLRRLDIALGDTIKIGEIAYQVRAVIEHEPDRLSRGFILGPTFMVSRASLAATGLEQPGSLIRYHYRLRLPAGSDVATFRNDLNETFPEAGWRIRDTREAAPGLRRFIQRLTLFLTLVGLTSLLVGGVGIANAVKSFLDTKADTIATLKCVGAPGRTIFQVYFLQVLILTAVGVAAGLLVGAVAPFIVATVLSDQLGWQSSTGIYPGPLMLGAAFGVLTVLAFTLWPLARAQRVNAASLFRAHVVQLSAGVGRGAWIAIAVLGIALAVLTVVSANDRFLAVIYVGAAAGTLLTFRLIALGLTTLARRAPRARKPGLRLAVANLHRPGAATGSVVVSLGLGITVLVAVALIEGNLSLEVEQTMPEEAPAFYFLDIQPDQIEDFETTVTAVPGAGEIRRVPMLRGRITAVNGLTPDQLTIPDNVAWVFRGDRGLTWSRAAPEAVELTAGTWWSADYDGEPLVSLDHEVGAALGIGPGDTLTVNVLGRNVQVTIANLRLINWGNLSINFVMIFSPGLLETAPQTHIATVEADPGAEDDIEVAVTDRFANVSAIRVKDALEAFSELIGKIAIAVRVTALVALLAGVLVLGGAVAAGHQRRVYDAVVFKVLGATRRTVAQAFVLEYGLLGLATAVIAAVIGSIAAYFVLTELMEMQFVFLPVTAAGTALLAAVLTVGFGLAGTWRALSHKAAPLLRNE